MTDPHQPELFSQGPAAPIDVAPGAAQHRLLAASIPRGILLGTSSWTFPGWEDLVYDRRASPAVLANHGLAAYARHPLLGCVGLDRTYYGPVPPTALSRYREQTPGGFRVVVKADRRLLFPGGPGSDPDIFLDSEWAGEHVVSPTVAALGDRLGALLFQFPPLPADALGGPLGFAERLHRFLASLPQGPPYAVEIRTRAHLTRDYVHALEHGGAAHAFVVHPEMPTLSEQRRQLGGRLSGTTVIRWMLHPRHTYAAAREAWAPFDRVRQPDPASRVEVAELAKSVASAGGTALVVVNNKAEGSSPMSIISLARELGGAPRATL